MARLVALIPALSSRHPIQSSQTPSTDDTSIYCLFSLSLCYKADVVVKFCVAMFFSSNFSTVFPLFDRFSSDQIYFLKAPQ